MDTIHVTNHRSRRMFLHILSIFVILAMAFPASTVAAASSPPFLGHWRAVDVDGSDIRLTIAGRPDGPFQITWTENYLSFCNGEAGIVRGTGWLVDGNPNLLDANVRVECFTTGAELDLHIVWRYHPMTNTLSGRYDNGTVTIWMRPGGGQAEEPPALGLRVNYGHDWVESFYEGGHTAWISVTDADGNLKATAELLTEPKSYWGGETGFQSFDGIWFDWAGNQMENPPDILPYDWVYGWVDNGASAQVQIGDISGEIDLANDSIEGTIYAPWFTEAVQVECLDWGSGQEPPFDNQDAGFKLTDGEDPYSCSWAEWDIQPYQNVVVGYSGPDGHWVANVFFDLSPRIVASEAGDWFWVTEFNVGTLDLFLYESSTDSAPLLWSGTTEVTDTWGITFVGYDMHGQDFLPGNYLMVSDGETIKGLVLETITVDVFDTETEIMAGTAPLGREVWAAAGPQEWQERIMVTAHPETGAWLADFNTIGFDITEEMRGWSSAAIYDEDGDANEGGTPPPPPNPRFVVFPEWEWFDGYDWPDGATVNISVANKPQCTTSKVSEGSFFNGSFGEGCDLAIGDEVTFSDVATTHTHTVQSLTILEVDDALNTVAGTAVPGTAVHVWPHGYNELIPNADGDGYWFADFDDLGIDLAPGMGGRSEIRDDVGNATAVDWYIRNPVIFAHPVFEVIEGVDWTPGSTVTVNVNDPASGEGSDYSDTQTASNDGWLHFQLVDFDLQSGHIITMTDDAFTKTMTVSSLRVTGFNLDAHTLYGVGDPNTEFLIADNAMPVSVDGEGMWSVAYDALTPGSWWTIIQHYPDGNEVRETFRVPKPVISAHPAYNYIEGHEWTPLGEVTITINDPTNGSGVDYTQTEIAGDNINYLYDTRVHFPLSFDLKPGHIITMTDGQYTQTMVVSSLQVTGFDLDAHTLYGTGDPGSEFIVVGVDTPVTVGDDGKWAATFEGLTPGSWWTILQLYPDGNEVRETFRAPMPMMIAWKNWDDVAGSEWTPGTEVTLTIDDPTNGPGIDFTFTDVAENTGNLYYGEVYFDLDIELQTGYVLTMSDGNFTKTLVLSALTVTGYDFDAHTIYGMGDPGTQLLVHLGGQESETVTVGNNHTWSVYHELLVPGVWFDAIQSDEDGDQTRDGRQAI